MKKWYVYILECSDGSYYTGSTCDVKGRIEKHNDGKASKYTRSRLPVRLIYLERFGSRSSACSREHRIKKMTRKEKEALVNGEENPLR